MRTLWGRPSRFATAAIVAACTLAFVGPLAGETQADEVELKNGDRLTGKIVKMTDGELLIETGWSKPVQVTWAEVLSVKTDAPLPFHMGDGTVLQGTASPADVDGQIGIQTDSLKGRIRMGDISSINPPPPEEKPAVVWSGFIRAGAIYTDGNTRTWDANAAGQIAARSEKLRLTLRALWNYGENKRLEGRRLIKRNALGEIKLDVFLSSWVYAYANALFQADTFQDLSLRSAFGAGLGIQWVENETITFMTEAGLAYVVDHRRRAEDTETLAIRLAWSFTWKIIPDRLAFFHLGEAYPSVERDDDIFVNTSTGVRFTFVQGLFASAQVDHRWDNTPSPGFRRSDWTYILSIGYEF